MRLRCVRVSVCVVVFGYLNSMCSTHVCIHVLCISFVYISIANMLCVYIYYIDHSIVK